MVARQPAKSLYVRISNKAQTFSRFGLLRFSFLSPCLPGLFTLVQPRYFGGSGAIAILPYGLYPLTIKTFP